MVKYLIATHGELSKELLETAKLIIGDINNVETFCMTKEKSYKAAEEELVEIIDKSEKLIVLTDLFGGSVANILTTKLIEKKSFDLITGVNLPMVLSVLLSQEENTSVIVESAIVESREGIVNINKYLEEESNKLLVEDDLDDIFNES